MRAATSLFSNFLLAGDGGGGVGLVFLAPLFLTGLEGLTGVAVGSAKLRGLPADVARQVEVEPAVTGEHSTGEPGKVAEAGEDSGGEPGKVAVAGEVVGVGHRVDAGGSDCGGDFIKQFLTALGLPLFLFWPRGTALTWEVTSNLPSL